MPELIKNAQSGKLKYIIGDGQNIVDWTYIKNVSDSHIIAAEALADGKPVSGKVDLSHSQCSPQTGVLHNKRPTDEILEFRDGGADEARLPRPVHQDSFFARLLHRRPNGTDCNSNQPHCQMEASHHQVQRGADWHTSLLQLREGEEGVGVQAESEHGRGAEGDPQVL